MSTYLLIDASNLIWASFFKALADDGIDPEHVPSGYASHIYNFRGRLQKCLKNLNLNSCEMVFALDEKPLDKYAIYPEYKAGRKTKDIKFNPKPASMKCIQEWNCMTIASQDKEADDAIASFAKKYYTTECIILSTDKDLWQICELPNVKVYNTFTHEIITQNHLKKHFDDLNDFRHVSLYKTIFGDSSDNIKSLLPRFKKKIVPIIKKTDGFIQCR